MPSTKLPNIDLEKNGIKDWKEIYYNLSFEELFNHEIDPALQGYEKVVLIVN